MKKDEKKLFIESLVNAKTLFLNIFLHIQQFNRITVEQILNENILTQT